MICNKKICFFPGDLNPGGIGHLMINLSAELHDRGFEVHFFLTERKHLIENEIPNGVKVFKSGGSVKSTLNGLVSHIRRENPYAVISGRDSLNIVNVLACKLSGKSVRAITSVHVDYSAEELALKSVKSYLYRFFGFLLGFIFYRLADETIAVSEGVAKNHTERFLLGKNMPSVIYNPAYKDYNESIIEQRSQEYINNLPKPVIVSVGRLTPQKGYVDLIKAFKLFIERNNQGSLLILGEGEDREKLEKLIESDSLTGFVYLPGYVMNPKSYIKYCDLFVLSSIWEGFGNVIVEALGVGSKIVSTDCKSGPREILNNGEFGTLVTPGNPEALCGGIENELGTNREPNRQIERAREFSVGNIADQYLNIIYAK